MKQITILLLFFCISSCSTYELATTVPLDNNVKTNGKDGSYLYENDTLAVSYNLWANHGMLFFEVYNKLNIPIYIDWKKSAFIFGETKRNYYSDKEIRTINTHTNGGSIGIITTKLPIANVLGGSSSSFSKTTGTEVAVKEERITFIPPNTKITKIVLRLLWKFDNNSKYSFSNFLTYSTKEDFSQEHYINNKFVVDKVKRYRKREFIKFIPDKSGVFQEHFIYESPTAFYIKNSQ